VAAKSSLRAVRSQFASFGKVWPKDLGLGARRAEWVLPGAVPCSVDFDQSMAQCQGSVAGLRAGPLSGIPDPTRKLKADTWTILTSNGEKASQICGQT
jgi:hypothetical protein